LSRPRLVSIDALPWFPYAFKDADGGRPIGGPPIRGPAICGDVRDPGRALGTHGIGLRIQRIAVGCRASRRHRHLFQEELLIVMSGTGVLIHDVERVPVKPGDCIAYLAGDPEPHTFENTGTEPLVIWAFGDRRDHEVCLYPDEGVAFVEGLGGEVPLEAVEREHPLLGRTNWRAADE
jgi:uncharacterized cupin superfamily protein